MTNDLSHYEQYSRTTDPAPFTPVKPTSEKLEYADLATIDMKTFDQGEEERSKLAFRLKEIMTKQGFFYLTNYGISEAAIKRQVDIGHHVLSQTPLEEKQKLRSQMQEEGTYKGFKLRNYYKGIGGVTDKIEQFNWFRDMKSQTFPTTILPFFDEVQAFTEKLHKHVLFNVLRLFAMALELPSETLVDRHQFNVHDESWMRYMAYYDEYTAEEEAKTNNVWLGGHQDFGSLTLLFSQPMTSLQVRNADDDAQWKYVQYVPGALVINAGEFMEWYTNGYFKAAVHRVVAPPKDQRNHTRMGVFYFVVPNDDEKVDTLTESPVLNKAGAKPREVVVTSKEYSCARIRKVGQTGAHLKDKQGKVSHEEVIKGVKTPWFA